jgi:hypothetical protein
LEIDSMNAENHWRREAGLGRNGPVAVALLFAALSILLGGCFRLGADARGLRDAAMASVAAGGEWDEQIEIRVGSLSLGLVRSISAFGDVDDEAKRFMHAVRGAEVGVYELRGSSRVDPSTFIESTTSEMAARSWDRVLAVVDGRDTVAVFVPSDMQPDESLRICVAVFDGRELVVARTRLDLEPVMRVVFQEHLREKSRDRKG